MLSVSGDDAFSPLMSVEIKTEGSALHYKWWDMKFKKKK